MNNNTLDTIKFLAFRRRNVDAEQQRAGQISLSVLDELNKSPPTQLNGFVVLSNAVMPYIMCNL